MVVETYLVSVILQETLNYVYYADKIIKTKCYDILGLAVFYFLEHKSPSKVLYIPDQRIFKDVLTRINTS